MTSLNRPQTSSSSMSVEEAVRAAWEGRVRIPNFQRQLRWTADDAIKLMDSIAKGYPIGNLLLWNRPAMEQQLTLGDLVLQAPETERAFWVVDGQQRLTVLANALSPNLPETSRFSLYFDLRTENFSKATSRPLSTQIPLGTLFDLRKVLEWFSNNPDLIEYVQIANAMTQQIRQYSIPAYIVESENPAVLRDIFDRMNNYGKQLTRAEVFTALHSSDVDSSSRPSFSDIARDINSNLNYGYLDDNAIMASILATRGPEVRREIRTEFEGESEEQINQAYQHGQAALHRAITFLQAVGVPHVTFLPYSYPLVVLSRFFGLFPTPNERSLELLERWFWRTVAAGPENFKGGTPNAARVLCGKISRREDLRDNGETSSLQGLLAAVPKTPNKISLKRFAPQDASTKLLLCAQWNAKPQDPSSGIPYSLSALSESVGSYPTAKYALQKPSKKSGSDNSIGAYFLLPGGEVKLRQLLDFAVDESSNGSPLSENYGEARVGDILESHFIRGFYGSISDVIHSRNIALAKGLDDFLSIKCGEGLPDTPNLSIFDFDAYGENVGGEEDD